jgi:dihydroneopterin aldolase
MGSIYIKDLIIEAKHGVHPHEKQNAQRFNVSVKLTVDIEKAG